MRTAVAFLVPVMVMAISACETTPTPSPSHSPTPGPTVAAATPSPVPAALPIVVGMLVPPGNIVYSPFLWMSNYSSTRAPGFRTDLPVQLVYNAIYRYDDTFTAVPDLAAEPCAISDDGLTITVPAGRDDVP